MKETFENLFSELDPVLAMDEIAYLSVESEELEAIYKRDSRKWTNEEWLEFHKEHRTFVKDNSLLLNIVETKQVCRVEDTDKLPTKPYEFEILKIKSIYLFPVIKEERVVGIIDIVYYDDCYKLSDEKIEKFKAIINKHQELITNY